MNKELIIQMARDTGATPYTNRHYPDRPTHTFNVEQLERFAALVAAAEREACAQVCEEYESDMGYGQPQKCADAIRARGESK